MSRIIEYSNLNNIKEKSKEKYDTNSHVEYIGDVGLNKAKFFCC